MILENEIIYVHEYQKKWICDQSKFKIANKARQIGLTWATMLELVLDCCSRRTRWYFLSASERQSIEALMIASDHIDALIVAHNDQNLKKIQRKKTLIEFPNGSLIAGLPANPRTARGSSGNIVLDEFAHQQNSEKIYTAAYPIATRGNHRMIILSTPNGKQGKYYDIWLDETHLWSKHYIDIDLAVKQGMPVDIDVLKMGCGSDDMWLQEYCGVFLDEATAWLTYDLIESAYHPNASSDNDEIEGECYLGVDIGRKRDLTVLWLLWREGDVFWTQAVQTFYKAKFSTQRQAIADLLPRVRKCCIDRTGIGEQLTEELETMFPSTVEGISMTGKNPAVLSAQIKKAFEDKKIRIPDDVEIRKDLHSVRRVYTDVGNVRFEAPRTKDGHADRYWALALAINASRKPEISYYGYESVEKNRFDNRKNNNRNFRKPRLSRW